MENSGSNRPLQLVKKGDVYMKKIIALTLLVLMVLALVPISGASGVVPVIKAEFPIVINGRIVENAAREYPFLLCNSITYFPMTYDDCAFLGLFNNWSAETGNVIDKMTPSGVYKEFIDPLFSYTKKGETATVVTTPITVLGEKINNAAETYPILNYKNVLYFPLTWDWGQKFGWNISFSEDKKLEVTTQDFADTGYFYTYSINGSEVKEEKHKLSDVYADSLMYGTYTNSCSPNYAWGVKDYEGFTTLFRLITENEAERVISVRNDMASHFLANGWYKAEDGEKCLYEFIKTHSLSEFRKATSNINYGKLGEILNPTIRNITENYVSLYTSDFRCCAVPESEVYAYTSAGWMKEDDFLIEIVNYYESKKDYGKAMTVLEKTMGILYEDIPGFNCPELYDADYSLVESLYSGIRERYVYAMGGNITLRAAIFGDNDPSVIIDAVLPGGKFLRSFDMSYDVIDSVGNVLYSVNETKDVYCADFNADKTLVKSVQLYLGETENPYAVGISNVKFSNLIYDNLSDMPLGAG